MKISNEITTYQLSLMCLVYELHRRIKKMILPNLKGEAQCITFSVFPLTPWSFFFCCFFSTQTTKAWLFKREDEWMQRWPFYFRQQIWSQVFNSPPSAPPVVFVQLVRVSWSPHLRRLWGTSGGGPEVSLLSRPGLSGATALFFFFTSPLQFPCLLLCLWCISETS